LGTADETHVSEVDVLVFGSDSKYLCRAYAQGQDIVTDAGNSNKKTFDVDLNGAGNATGAYIMVVANAHDAVETVNAASPFTSSVTTKGDVTGALEFGSAGKWNAAGSGNFKPFPMCGGLSSVDLSNTASVPVPSIPLIRSVAKIDVEVNLTGGASFTLESVRLYNSLKRGLVAPLDGNFPVTGPAIPPSLLASDINGELTYLLGSAADFSNNLSCTNVIYMAEQSAEPAIDGGGPAKRPCLVIGGKYNGSNTPTYYRLDFVSGNYPDQEFLPVLRNHRYRFNITGVAGPGYTSAALAAEARPVNFTYNLSATDESLTSYDYNGQYALGVSQDSYTFDKDGKSGNSLKISATFGKYSVEINPVTPTNNIDWLTGVTGAGDNVAAFGELTFNVATNNSGGERSAEIVITSGLLTKKVTVTQSNKAGFNVELVSGTHYTSYNKKTVTVASSYDWCVNVEDPHGIITQFDAKGTSSTNTFSFTPKASTYYSQTEASFTFFSPTGEFDPVTKTISVPATSGQYLPSAHKGWAGSNIYWDTTSHRLTFADTPSPPPSYTVNPTTPETYQGVFFKWGSLYGLDPSYTSQGSTSWGNNCKVYVPDWNPNDPYTSTWTEATVGSTYTWDAIPWANGQTSETNASYAYLTMDAGASAIENTSVGGHVPVKGKSVANQKMIGDICRYLTQTGDAPGSGSGTRWRMPTAAEFAVTNTATTDYVTNPNRNNWSSATGNSVNSPAGTYEPLAGRRKTNNITADYQPWLPASGQRLTSGALGYVGDPGHYWMSTPCGNAGAYFLRISSGSGLGIDNDDNTRLYGFNVRCVKEL
jgi:hypothetical protein